MGAVFLEEYSHLMPELLGLIPKRLSTFSLWILFSLFEKPGWPLSSAPGVSADSLPVCFVLIMIILAREE